MELLDVLNSILTASNILFLCLGVIGGLIGGALPGISPSMTIALLLPMSLYLPTSNAIMLLIGAYQGAMYGGSISAILINTPGTASAAATAFDGYEMARQGKAGKAIGMALTASCSGGFIASIVLILMAKHLALVSLKFGPAEYFGIMLFALTLIAGVCGDNLLKGLMAATFGLLLATVGMDPVVGTERLTFGLFNLYDGFSMLSVFIGVFALSEILVQLRTPGKDLDTVPEILDYRQDRLTFKEYWSQKWNILISGLIGCFIGILPGLGGSTASFIAYAEAKRRSKTPEKFGTGIIDGVAAAESANNGVCGGALIPMLALGIPGDVVTAILIGAFVAQGIKPGPLLFTQNLKDVYAIYFGLILSIIALFIIGMLSLRFIAKIVSIKKSILFPCVFILCVVGTYAARGNLFDCLMMILFGLFGYFLRRHKFQIAPFIIAYILGPEVELNYRLALRISDMNYLTFIQKPISLFFIGFTALFIVFSIFKKQFYKRWDSKAPNCQ